MKEQLLRLLGAFGAIGLAAGCTPTPHEEMVIEKEITLSPGHLVTPYGISKAYNGDLLVFGATGTDGMDFRPWLTRISQRGETRWEFVEGAPDGWSDKSGRGQRYNNALELADQTIVLCGIKNTSKGWTALLDHLSSDGSLIEERLIDPDANTGHLVGLNCAPWGHGLALAGAIYGVPRGTGWLARVDENLHVQWEKIDPDYKMSDLIPSDDGGMFMLSWSGQDYFILKLGPTGGITARHSLPTAEQQLVHPIGTSESGVRVVELLSQSKTVVLRFDDKLSGAHKTTLNNAGPKTSVELPDGSIAILGCVQYGGPTAAVTRVYNNGSYKGFFVQPTHQSPWYTVGVATGVGNEVVATRLLFDGHRARQVLDWISFK